MGQTAPVPTPAPQNVHVDYDPVQPAVMTPAPAPAPVYATAPAPASSGLKPLGIVGAIAGALVGCIIWIVIYAVGFISAIGGFAIAFGAIKGYEMATKNVDKMGALVAILCTLIGVYLAWRPLFASKRVNGDGGS